MADDAPVAQQPQPDTGAGVGAAAAILPGQGADVAGGDAAAHALIVLGQAEGPPAAGEGGAPAGGGGAIDPPPADGENHPLDGAADADPAAEGQAGPGLPPGPIEAGSDSDDDSGEGKAIDSDIARAATNCGCLAAVTDSLRGMCELAGDVPCITAPLLGNHMVINGAEVTSLQLSTGVGRVLAVSTYVDKLLATSEPPTLRKDGLVCAFLAVLGVLFPEPSSAPLPAATRAGGAVPAAADRDGSPDTAFITKLSAFMTYREDHKTSSKECSAQDMRELGGLIAPLVGSASKGAADLASTSQTKSILKEIGQRGCFPSDQSCQPEKIVRYGGDSHLSAPKAEKGKDVVAEETSCARVLRARFRTFCITIGAVFLKQPDTVVECMKDAAIAALAMNEALVDAEHLVTYKQVETAINSCLKAARTTQNGDDRRRRGFAVACERGAHAISEANNLAYTFKAMGVAVAAPSETPGPSTTPPPGDDGKPLTFKQLKQALTGLKPNGGKAKKGNQGGDPPKKERRFAQVELPDGKGKKQFERLQGGNPDCPVMCPHNHAKSNWCHFNHSKK